MFPSPKDGGIEAETFGKPRVFVTSFARGTRGIPHRVVIWISDVNFPRRDANDWPVLLVQLDDLERVLAA